MEKQKQKQKQKHEFEKGNILIQIDEMEKWKIIDVEENGQFYSMIKTNLAQEIVGLPTLVLPSVWVDKCFIKDDDNG